MNRADLEAIIVDFDGTIIDTETGEYESIAAEFRRHGVEYTVAEHRTVVGRIDHPRWFDVLQERVGPIPDVEGAERRRRDAHLASIEKTGLRPGIDELIERAGRRALALAIASSSPRWWIDLHLGARGLDTTFPVIATGDLVPRAKPWPEVFLLAAEGLDVDPAGCLAIEDSHHGVTAAKAAGMMCVAVPNPVTAGSDFSAADLVLDSLADLPWADFGLE